MGMAKKIAMIKNNLYLHFIHIYVTHQPCCREVNLVLCFKGIAQFSCHQ